MRDPLRYHNKNHCSVEGTFETCWRCGRDLAVCLKKIRFDDWREVNEWMEWRNAERLWMPPHVMPYRCRWCGGWHLKTAKHVRNRARMEKLARRRRVEMVKQLHQRLANDMRSLCGK